MLTVLRNDFLFAVRLDRRFRQMRTAKRHSSRNRSQAG